MFEIRKLDFNRDKEEVLQLIRKNLDPSYSEEFFIWKHFLNPFGKSFGLVAMDGQVIIALRIFMFWEFYDGASNRILRAIRPVDTLVDSKYRGKGFFKKLTLKGLDLCETKYDIVFNTPNDNSFPGYLKMGWSLSKGQGSFIIGIIKIFGNSIKVDYMEEQFLKNLSKPRSGIRTHLTSQYLNWRYKDVKYKKVVSGSNYIIFTKNKIKGVPVLFIYEFIGDQNILQKMLIALFKKTLIPFIYFYENGRIPIDLLLTFPRKNGTIVFRDDKLNVKNEIAFSMGDLEGKL